MTTATTNPFPEVLTVTLCADDFKRGRCGHPSRCAVALAALRALPRGTQVQVTSHEISAYATGVDEHEAYYVGSPELARIIERFDKAFGYRGAPAQRAALGAEYDGSTVTFERED